MDDGHLKSSRPNSNLVPLYSLSPASVLLLLALVCFSTASDRIIILVKSFVKVSLCKFDQATVALCTCAMLSQQVTSDAYNMAAAQVAFKYSDIIAK